MTEHEEVVKSIKSKIGFKPHILETLEELDPEFLGKYKRCDGKLLSDGALSAKTKILMAFAVVASKQCEACAVAQMRSALNHGVTKRRNHGNNGRYFYHFRGPSCSCLQRSPETTGIKILKT